MIKTIGLSFLATTILLTATQALASNQHKSHYAGQERRLIKSFSKDDITELKRGGGWGLAKAAELNGMPGPVHILEMKKEIGLTREQVKSIKEIHAKMKAKATELGNQFIALEMALESSFQSRKITKTTLKKQLGKIGDVRSALRYTHLAAHLETLPVLTERQVTLYNRLRGYDSDPCASVPANHDPVLWRKHNGCE